MRGLSRALLFRPGLFCLCAAILSVLLSLFFTLLSIPVDPFTAATGLTTASVLLAYGGFLGFSGFAVVSYQLLTALRRAELTETVLAIPSGYSKTQCYLVRRMVLGAGVYFLLLVALTQGLLTHVGPTAPKALRWNFALAAILYALLPAALGILWGFAGHFNMNKILFGILTFLGAFLGSPIAAELYISAGVLGSTLGGLRLGAVFQTVLGFFYHFVPIIDNGINATYGLPVELYRLATAAFWVLALGGLSLLQSRRVRWLGVVCAVLCIPVAAVAVSSRGMGVSGLYTDLTTVLRNDWDGQGNYQYKTADADTLPFDVLQYELNFSFSDMLHADAEMELSEQNQKKYVFTLYHGYAVSSAEDENGHPLQFSQENDLLTVYPLPGQALKAIRIRYSGWNNVYYSNWQGAFLPCFCYFYPVPGSHEMYTEPDTAEASFIVTAPENCFLNLPHRNSTWSGTASCLNLVRGIYQKAELEGTQYIIPWEAEVQHILPELRQALAQHTANWLDSTTVDEITFVVYSPTFNLPYKDRPNESAVCGNTLFVAYSPYAPLCAEDILPAFLKKQWNGSFVGEWYEKMLTASARGEDPLRVFTLEFGTLEDREYLPVPGLSGEQNTRREVGYYLGLALQQWGEETVMREIEAYMSTDAADDVQFAKTLWQKGAS